MPDQPGKDNRHPTTKAKVPAFVFIEGRRDGPQHVLLWYYRIW